MRTLMFAFSLFVAFSVVSAPEAHALGKIFKRNKNAPKPPSGGGGTVPLNPRTDLSMSCRRMREGTTTGLSGCAAGQMRFLNHLYAARDAAPRTLFRGDGAPHDPAEYADSLIGFLDRTYGLCAVWDGQALMVRDATDSNEVYRIIGPNNVADFFFTTNCAPARKFPTRDNDLDPANSDPYCSYPRSNVDETATCVGDTGQGSAFLQKVNSSIDEIIAEQRIRPTMLTLQDGQPNPVIINKGQEQAWLARVVEKVRARGYCVASDGGQGVAVKSTNTFSEFFALVVLGQEDAQGRHPIRRKFTGSCNPAEF